MPKIKSLQSLLFLTLLVWLTACQHTLALQSDSAYLDSESERLPRREPIAINARIMLQEQASSIEDSPRIYTSKAGTPFSITLPYTEMLNQAGHASINRWFRQTSDRADNIYVSVELIELYYNNHTDVGSNQPIISVKLYISTKQGSSVVQEGTYESGQIKGEKFSMTFLVGTGSKFEEYFSRAAYRAILIAMDRAMEDVAQKIK